ncbi:ABC transporter permease [Brevibacillus sp. SIMBA_040]|uniref:ABC transporter permease n=1 Tax=unclassified Brevibacillus TaxID=2684853 RepID=UPI00397D8942
MQKQVTSSNATSVLAPVIMFFILFGTWQFAAVGFDIPRWILPNPVSIIETMFVSFGEFAPHIGISIVTIVCGFLVAVPIGILLAALITNFKMIDTTLSPFVIFLVITPLITLVPLLMIWFGFGIEVKMLAVVIQSFPIVMMNSATGFNNVENIRLELMKSLCASRWQTFTMAILPSALPNVFTGIKLASIFATIAAVTSELIGGNIGIGSQIIKYSQYMQTEKAFACIFFTAIIGTTFYGLINLVERKIVRWKI